MDFRTELAKWGYNKGNSIDVDILVNEILPSLFSQQEKSNNKEEVWTMCNELGYYFIGGDTFDLQEIIKEKNKS